MALHTTINDMLKLARALLDETSSPLSAVAFDDKAEKVTWGRRIAHWGWVNGFSSSFYVDRDAKQAVVVWVKGHSSTEVGTAVQVPAAACGAFMRATQR